MAQLGSGASRHPRAPRVASRPIFGTSMLANASPLRGTDVAVTRPWSETVDCGAGSARARKAFRPCPPNTVRRTPSPHCARTAAWMLACERGTVFWYHRRQHTRARAKSIEHTFEHMSQTSTLGENEPKSMHGHMLEITLDRFCSHSDMPTRTMISDGEMLRFDDPSCLTSAVRRGRP